jgi:uncharacterized protein YggU (UPF0235/DUF167 family)
MSKVTEILRNYAQEEKRAHEEYVKDFSTSTIKHLVEGGVDREKANQITKEACLRDDNLKRSIAKAVILEKAAQYIDALEEENTKLQVKINESPVEKQAETELPVHLRQLKNLGFSDEEIHALDGVPQTVIEKVAAAASEPYELGRGVGPAVDKMDPFLEFILS